jgi:hypothetical protein
MEKNAGSERLWIEGIVGPGNTLIFFDYRLSPEEGAILGTLQRDGYWTAIVSARTVSDIYYIWLPKRMLRIPEWTINYNLAAPVWFS